MCEDAKEIYVKDWISYDEAQKLVREGNGEEVDIFFGGFFGRNVHTWDDYLDRVCGHGKILKRYLSCLRKHIVENSLRMTGEEHQKNDKGVPVLSNGAIMMFSKSAWGDLMAAIWTEEEGKQYKYIDFYMLPRDGKNDE